MKFNRKTFLVLGIVLVAAVIGTAVYLISCAPSPTGEETPTPPTTPPTQPIPEDHTEIYKEAQKKLNFFPVLYPSYLPEGSRVIDFTLGGDRVRVKYSSNIGEFEIIEGAGDLGIVDQEFHEVQLENGKWATIFSFVYNGVTTSVVYFAGGMGYICVIHSPDISEEELLKIVNSMKSVE